MNSYRRIAHLDMDAFFASVELLRYPELRGRAVVVGGRNIHQPVRQADGTLVFARLRDYTGRGVITTATYEGRALGVHSGMGLMKAANFAPNALLLPANFDAYRESSLKFKAAVAAIAPKIEDRGIDEIYIDLSDLPEASYALAKRIKQAVFEACGLTCSIGISPNKLLSKICSDLDKPDGITILEKADIPSRIWPLPAKKINGIGPKAAQKLGLLGVNTIGQLAAMAPDILTHAFGPTTGLWLHHAANGIDERPVKTESEPKSISRESTFERDMHVTQDKPALSAAFTSLCLRVAQDLQKKGYRCRTIGVKVRYADFHVVTRDTTLQVALDDGMAIRKAAGQCLRRVELNQRIRLLGVRAGALQTLDNPLHSAQGQQGELQF